MADEGEKKIHNSFELKRNVFGRLFGKKKKTPTLLLYYLQRATTFEYLVAAFSALPLEYCHWSPPQISVPEDVAAQYGSWPHLSGNCYRWFNSLADRTPSKHHPRVWGPQLD